MRYAKINEAIWTDEKITSVSDSAKLFYIYLLSCSSCNSIGLFRIGLGLIEDEFCHSREQVMGCINELENACLIEYRKGWLWFSKFLRWNEPISPNHARKCAADLNDCILKGAPKEAVFNFLASVKPILSRLKIKGGDRTYFDEFMSALDTVLVTDYLGGEAEFRKAFNSSYGLNRSASEVLDKDLRSTGEALGNKDNNNNKTSTRQDNTRLVCTCENGEPSERLILCSDGIPHAIGADALRLAQDQFGDEFDNMINDLQKSIIFARTARPSAERLDDWFLQSMGMRSGAV